MDSTCSEVEGLIDENFGKTYKLAKKGIDDLTKSFNFRINYLGLSQLVSATFMVTLSSSISIIS